MFRRLLRVLLVPVCASAAVTLVPVDAQAESGVTVTFGSSATLSRSHVVVTAPTLITCAPIGDIQVVQAFGTLEQAAGRAIASGSAAGLDQPLVCDGTPHPNTVTYLADPAGPPFHGGPASAELAMFIYGSGGTESGGSGFQTIRLS